MNGNNSNRVNNAPVRGATGGADGSDPADLDLLDDLFPQFRQRPGESLEQFRERVKPGWEALVADHDRRLGLTKDDDA